MNLDEAGHEAKFRIKKYNTDEARRTGEPDEISEFKDNVFLEEGIGAIWDLATGLGSPTVFNEANSYIGVGNGTASEDATHSGLQGGSTFYKGMDTGFPSRSGTTITWRATFGDTEANFSWEEFTVANGSSDTALNINRKQSSQGTKSSGATWELEVKLTIT